ncbi:hypothetical protein KI387_030180, partial [Taxus chinensis]
WKDMKVKYGGKMVSMNEELISKVTWLALDSIRFFSKRVDKNVEAKKFTDAGEEIIFVMSNIQ